MFCQRGSEFFLLALCVCVCEGDGGVRFSTSPSVKKITDHPSYECVNLPERT